MISLFQYLLSNSTCAAISQQSTTLAAAELTGTSAGLCRLNQVDPKPIAYNLSNQ
jgi:hypothetical protein